jgi:hypothetical protein
MAEMLQHRIGIDFPDRADLEFALPLEFLLRQKAAEPGGALLAEGRKPLVDSLSGERKRRLSLWRPGRCQPAKAAPSEAAKSAEKLLAFAFALRLKPVTSSQFGQGFEFVFRCKSGHSPLLEWVRLLIVGALIEPIFVSEGLAQG